MQRWLAGLVGALALVGAGCSGGATTSSAPGSSTTAAGAGTSAPPGTPPPTFAAGDRYVALGSSIASGFGISVQSTDCGRSDRNYPNLVAWRYQVELVDVTCGAATIANVVDTPQGPNPPQLQAVTPDTKLVTVTVGGNDIGYNATAVACGDPQSVCTLPEGFEADLATARTALAAMLDHIRAAAPEATIVFVTYPREVPDPADVPGGNCPDLSFADEEAAVVRTMGDELEALFVEVVATHDDVVFVDPYVEEGDHTGCAEPGERWVAGHVAEDGFAYHPTAHGHEVMALLIDAALASAFPR